MDLPTARSCALIISALANGGQRAEPADLMAYAAPLVPWIMAAATAVTTQLAPAAAVDGRPVTIPPGGTAMPIAVAATVDNTTVVLTALPEDDHGDPTPDRLTVTDDDPVGNLATWVLSADTHTRTGTLTHAEGTVTVTFADPSAAGVAPLVFVLTIGPGATSQLAGTATVT